MTLPLLGVHRPVAPPVAGGSSALLLETNDALLLETGDRLLLE
jgi:hypothetical protein